MHKGWLILNAVIRGTGGASLRGLSVRDGTGGGCRVRDTSGASQFSCEAVIVVVIIVVVLEAFGLEDVTVFVKIGEVEVEAIVGRSSSRKY